MKRKAARRSKRPRAGRTPEKCSTSWRPFAAACRVVTWAATGRREAQRRNAPAASGCRRTGGTKAEIPDSAKLSRWLGPGYKRERSYASHRRRDEKLHRQLSKLLSNVSINAHAVAGARCCDDRRFSAPDCIAAEGASLCPQWSGFPASRSRSIVAG
jgi:hypothetical protein